MALHGQHLRKWKKFEAVGTPIDLIFIVCKTPLDRSVNFDDQTKRFTNEDLLDHFSKLPQKVGMLIDLTASDKYYDPSGIKKAGIEYVKYSCPGAGEFLPPEVVNGFIRLVNAFRSQHSDQLVCVHCTHGSNRTGFLIVAYFVQVVGMNVNNAIDLFALQRPPGIERVEIIMELRSRYNSSRSNLVVQSKVPKRVNEKVEVVEEKQNDYENDRCPVGLLIDF